VGSRPILPRFRVAQNTVCLQSI